VRIIGQFYTDWFQFRFHSVKDELANCTGPRTLTETVYGETKTCVYVIECNVAVGSPTLRQNSNNFEFLSYVGAGYNMIHNST
jgi:hypothetical protein